MKILFSGTPLFALPSLKTLVEKYTVTAVLTAPDKPKGRGREKSAPPVKEYAREFKIPVLQPLVIDREFREEVKALKPDLLVVAAYSTIFRKEFLDIFPCGGINVHPSLLPKFRGPSPIPAAILSGERKTGVTVQRLALKMDTGNILASKELALRGTETTAYLSEILSKMGAALLPGVIECMSSGSCEETVQDDEAASYCRLIKKADGEIPWEKDALWIERMIRAYTPWPSVYTRFRGTRLFFVRGSVYTRSFPGGETLPGTVLGVDKDYGILINTCNGILCMQELKLEHKKTLEWRAFLNGCRDFTGTVLGQ